MAAYYIYLISSLPELSFGQKPPFTQEEFIGRCAGLVPDREISLLGSILKGEKAAGPESSLLKGWRRFDSSLRNELVKLRAVRKKIEPHRYLREEGVHDAHIAGIATAAVRNPSILDAERALDLSRWEAIEELVRGHYFDSETLIAYALKLSILLRWDRVSSAHKAVMLEEITSVKSI